MEGFRPELERVAAGEFSGLAQNGMEEFRPELERSLEELIVLAKMGWRNFVPN